MTGAFVISLDFELAWGMREKEHYRANILGGRKALPRILNLLEEFNVKATIAAVGLLFYRTKVEVLAALPQGPVEYLDSRHNWYPDYLMSKVGADEGSDPCHFAGSLIAQIPPGHEVATHTFSHYYALEPKVDADAFRREMARMTYAESIVWPGHQYDDAHLSMCRDLGIKSFRGNERHWIYRALNTEAYNSRMRRLLRLIDSYLSVTGHNTHSWEELDDPSGLVNIPSSRFLRPYSPRVAVLDALRLRRITKAMTYAARENRIFHLWWHPHNFGLHTDENLAFLRRILDHYRSLEEYSFTSMTMSECAMEKTHDQPNNRTSHQTA